ncbi:MAG: ABC transporter permease [Deltaproteobacteria bacterium]|nr:ABC transporter permease [Deltaproteobacteria bacterium]
MAAYALRRLLQFIPTIVGVTLILFLLLNVLPGNAALMAGGPQETHVDSTYIELMKKEWGLDQPLYVRYLDYMGKLLVGDLGKSFLRRESVSGLLASRIWPTLKLAVVAMGVAVCLGVPLGFYSALRQGSWQDSVSMVGAVSGVSLPQFWLGLLLMFFFSVKLPVLPPQGYGDGALSNIILPGFTLGVGYMALLARTTRAAVVEILTTDYVRTARAKGLPAITVNRKHVLRNALILVLTAAGLQFGGLMGHTVIVEKLFSWPGVGSLLVDSIFQRDIPVTQGCIFFLILVFLLVNLAVDLLYAVIDPRIDYR